MNNPFTVGFGRKPAQYVSRLSQADKIVNDFTSSVPASQVNIITGVRGSGKTVLMTSIKEQFNALEDWIAIEVSVETDIMQSIAAQLYEIPELHRLFVKEKIDFSAFGLGVSFQNVAPVTDIGSAVRKMLDKVKKLNKKLLVCMDEVANNENVRIFSSYFQIYTRENLPIFALMTGLFENIDDLQNEKTLTFLYRAEKTRLVPLDMASIKAMYKRLLNLDDDTALEFSKLTNGYSFAFQVLGHLAWDNRDIQSILPEYDHYLSDYVYNKIWSELSPLGKKIILAASLLDDPKAAAIKEKLGITQNTYTKQRDIIKRKGLIDENVHGKLLFVLPRFKEFALNYVELLEE